MSSLSTLTTYLVGNSLGLQNSYTRAISLTQNYVNSVSASSNALASGMAGLSMATLAVGAASVYAFSTFEKNMVRSTSILLDATESQKRAMGDLALQMSGQTLSSANDLDDPV